MGAFTTVGLGLRRRVARQCRLSRRQVRMRQTRLPSRYLHLARQLPDARVQSSQKELTAGQLYRIGQRRHRGRNQRDSRQAYQAGDPLAREVLEETIVFLAHWLGNIVDLLEPD